MSTVSAREEALANALESLTCAVQDLTDARGHLTSFWQSVGPALSDAQSEVRSQMYVEIGVAKGAAERAKRWCEQAVPA